MKKSAIVFDIIYQPLKTKLLEIADNSGIATLNGLEMNLEQAVLAYQYAIKLKDKRNDLLEVLNMFGETFKTNDGSLYTIKKMKESFTLRDYNSFVDSSGNFSDPNNFTNGLSEYPARIPATDPPAPKTLNNRLAWRASKTSPASIQNCNIERETITSINTNKNGINHFSGRSLIDSPAANMVKSLLNEI